MIKFSHTLQELSHMCNGEAFGNSEQTILSVCSVDNPQLQALTFADSPAALKKLARTDIACIIKPDMVGDVECGIVHEHPQKAFRLILNMVARCSQHVGIAASAVVAETARIGNNVSIGHNVVIGDNVCIGDNVSIGHGSIIEADVTIGNDSRIGHRVVVHTMTVIGERCVISEGAVIAGQGFGFSFEAGQWRPMPQVGRVLIGNDVHIGGNTCIDRGAIDDTVIGDNVIIDNLVHIAHNVKVGSGTAMAASVGIAGSTSIGKYCLLAGQAGVVGHISIADGVQINGGAKVLQAIKEPGIYAGSFNALPVRQWNKLISYTKRLEKLFKREL